MRLFVNFVGVDGLPANPTTVTFRLKPPPTALDPNPAVVTIAGSQATPPVIGRWFAAYQPDRIGVWRYEAEGTGAIAALDDHYFVVDPSAFR